MADFERSMIIEADARKVYAFVADVANMPKYLPTTRHAEAQSGERVIIEGEARGKAYSDEGYLHVQTEFKRLQWGADTHDYSGWLDVNPHEEHSHVTVHLTFKDGQEDAIGQQRIEDSLQQALNAIRDHVV